MVEEMDELDKVDRAVNQMWEELHSIYAEDDRSSVDYLVEWNRIHAYQQVMNDVAFGIPVEGRSANAAVDAKTAVRVLHTVLERQTRIEAKLDQILGVQKFVAPILVAVVAFLLVSQFRP